MAAMVAPAPTSKFSLDTRQSGAQLVLLASVEIVRAERIETAPPRRSGTKTDRQFRRRGDVPLVEFY